MRDASAWAADVLRFARMKPEQLPTLIREIQDDARKDGFNEALSFATTTATSCLASLDFPDPAMPDYPVR